MSRFKCLMRSVLLVLCVVTGPLVDFAQDLQSKLPTDPNVETGKLANGLTYYIRNNHKPEKKVELRLVVNAGSILEDSTQQGLAHFMEHMNFNGTSHFQKNDLVSYLQSIGVQFGADLNAYTSFDQTVFILPIPTDKPGNLEKGFQIIEDWAHNALLTGKDIDEERPVVLEESRLGKGAEDRMRKIYFPKLTEGSLYADRQPIGKDEVLKTFKYDAVRNFYKDWYRPDLQAVVIVGDIDTATAHKMLVEHFGGLQNPTNERPRIYADVMPRKAPEAMVVTDKEATNSVVILTYPYMQKHDETTLGDYRESIVRQLAEQVLQRKLSDLAQGRNPPFPFAGIGFDDLVHGHEAFQAYAVFGKEGPEKALKALCAELLRGQKYGFTENDLELAKKDMMSEVENTYNERNTTDSKDRVDEYIRAFLDNEAFPGVENEYSYYKQMMPGIKVAEVNEEVKHWMNNPNTFTLITGPDKSDVKMPTNSELLVMTQKDLSQQVTSEAEKAVAKALMATKPAPGKVVSTRKEAELDAMTYTLSNGVQVTIKHTDFKNDEILMTGVKKGGAGKYGVADKSNINTLTSVVNSMGIGDFSPTDLEKVTAGKEISAHVSMGEVDDNVSASSTVNDFESMLQLAYLKMMQPRKDEGLFKAYKEKAAVLIQNMSSSPQTAFMDTTVKVLYNNNPLARTVILKDDDLDKIDLDRVLEIYKNEFSCADGYHFFIVGNVNADSILPLVTTYLGSLPNTGKTVDFKDNGVRMTEGKEKITYKKGTEPRSMIMGVYWDYVPYSEDLAMKAQAVAEVLNIKVIEDLREKMGGIYTGGFNASVSKLPYQHYTVQLHLPCGPENVDKLVAAANEEIKNIKENGPAVKDLDKVKSQWREKYVTAVKENGYWLGKLEGVLFWNADLERVLHYQDYIDKLTPEEIQATAKKLFNDKNQFISILYPES